MQLPSLLDPLPVRIQQIHELVCVNFLTGSEKNDFIESTDSVQKLSVGLATRIVRRPELSHHQNRIKFTRSQDNISPAHDTHLK